MRIGFVVGSVGISAILLACASSQRLVPVVGTEADLARLQGEWEGEYSSAVTGRSGSIVFHLTAMRDSAHGDVVMDPPRWGRGPVTGPVVAPSARETVAQPPQVLTINFVRVTGGRVSGTLAPYRAPDCDCVLLTTFDGTLKNDTLEGTYTSRVQQTGETQLGRWSVTRKQP